ncbi:hypothetical protein M9458_003835 [Cirrhinus mrigala]|uniref:SH3 domain-containing protein n=1 Tax=Cirrhinus mrigala TaxID=683832 RepID=A0ABD0RQ39_CIRMR
MAADGFQYRSVYSYCKDWEDDIDLEPGDILTGFKEGDEQHPECLGWIVGFNERTKQRGDFPGTYVQYVGPVKMSVPDRFLLFPDLSQQPPRRVRLAAFTVLTND